MKQETKKRSAIQSRPKLSFTVDRSEFDINSDWVPAVMAPPAAPPSKGPFLRSALNNATDDQKATGTENTPEEQITPDAQNICVAENAAGDNTATVDKNVTRIWKLKPLRRITDGLTSGQYAVYSLMLESGDAGQGSGRIYRGGYADLCRLTGLSKRGIQNVIGELQEKTVIRLLTAPGHHRLQTSVYEVPDPGSVLNKWSANGWRFAQGKSKRLTNGTTVAISATDAMSVIPQAAQVAPKANI
jgi:hypothetical protein